ncbi:TetR/AcrR family transcriptional regulator [Amycolatopsis sp. CA-230715]|uniref:TetR/AcrR family transcriptional regulator n=1 Tax=Amycolatopsis sp. CA-230715 TaxID=2745196 RepID=UPI001C02E954|nr:TetR/AcrR family transcriptional regulator [Amycolatopsis sp. CA-230715]QWF79330.1 hypothetical protein HUW46_02738 [Amycolatopsis sp. CA-230715]
MPRITEEHRAERRAEIVAAARRRFARTGFHQTSMPDIAKEAGVSVGAPYRYFAGKEEIILELAGDAFRAIFAPIVRLVDAEETPAVADLVAASIGAADATGDDELLRCGVQVWSELLTNDTLRERAADGFEDVRRKIAEVLRRGQAAGTVPAALEPERGSRVVMALLHGFVLQRVAFGLDDTEGFAEDVRAVLVGAGISVPRGATSKGSGRGRV